MVIETDCFSLSDSRVHFGHFTWCFFVNKMDPELSSNQIIFEKKQHIWLIAVWPVPAGSLALLSTNEYSLQWCHNECDSISNHQPHDCLLNRLFRHISKKTSKLHQWIPRTNGQPCGKCFHLMTSSCIFPLVIHKMQWWLIIPSATKLGGVYWIHPVCPSVCLSVR